MKPKGHERVPGSAYNVRFQPRAMVNVVIILWVLYAVPAALIVAEIGALALLHRSVITPFVECVVGPICHHIPSRTLSLPSIGLLPVCARCTGLYTGWITAFPVGFFAGRALYRSNGSPRLCKLLGVVFGLTLTAAIAASLEALGLLHTANITRLFLGFPLGFGPGLILILGARIVYAVSLLSQR